MLRQWWEMWARPITVIVSLISIGALGALYVRRPPQQWTITRHGITSLASQTEMDFMNDSVYVLRLAASDSAPYPVHLAFYYYGSGVTYSADEVRGAIASVVQSRPGATLSAIAAVPMFFELVAPGVLIKYDLWPNGGVRSEIVLRCALPGTRDMLRPVSPFYDRGNEGYSTIVNVADLAGDMNLRLSEAIGMKCPETSVASWAKGNTRTVTPRAAATGAALVPGGTRP